MDLKASELIKIGKVARDRIGNTPLETRALYALGRNSIAKGHYKTGYTVHASDIIEVIKSGKAWDYSQVGDKTIQIWAEWATGERQPPEKLKVIYD